MTLQEALPRLVCLSCRSRLAMSGETLTCTSCGKTYPIRNGAAVFTDVIFESTTNVPDPLVQRIKQILKRYERLYYALVPIVGALFVGRVKGTDVVKRLPEGALILNLGSGPKIISPHIANVDAEAFQGVLVAATADTLPFADGTVDGILCECLLEHVTDPVAVVAEAERVLKPGGLLYITIPFVDPYHSAPDDYYRWTTSGLRQLTKNFYEESLGMAFGPTSSMISAFAHFMGVLLSFGSRALYQVVTLGFQTILAPLRPLDYLFRNYPYATNSSLGYYYLGRKKG